MDIVALLIAIVALIVASVALTLVLIVFREFVRDTFVNRKLERPLQKDATGTDSGEQGSTARAANAPEQSVSSPVLHAPNLAPQALAPSIGRPPIPKGGFGTRVTKRDK
jgi:hypothetical protein